MDFLRELYQDSLEKVAQKDPSILESLPLEELRRLAFRGTVKTAAMMDNPKAALRAHTMHVAFQQYQSKHDPVEKLACLRAASAYFNTIR